MSTDVHENPQDEPRLVDLTVDDPRWDAALPVLQELRPDLTAETLAQVLREGTPQGLRFTAVFVGDSCVAVAGWRVLANMSVTRKMHVHDLATSSAYRSRGYGSLLLTALKERAREAGCRVIDLDSGVQRFDAHRFYLREKFDIISHHFSHRLG